MSKNPWTDFESTQSTFFAALIIWKGGLFDSFIKFGKLSSHLHLGSHPCGEDSSGTQEAGLGDCPVKEAYTGDRAKLAHIPDPHPR